MAFDTIPYSTTPRSLLRSMLCHAVMPDAEQDQVLGISDRAALLDRPDVMYLEPSLARPIGHPTGLVAPTNELFGCLVLPRAEQTAIDGIG